MAVGEKSPTLLLGDLPKTMARIRRLVREHPHDRELQRLLHHLLTTMSSDRVDEAAVGAVAPRPAWQRRLFGGQLGSFSAPLSTEALSESAVA